MLKDAAVLKQQRVSAEGALGYLALKDLLGDTQFRKGLHEFMSRWHGKHPIPRDMYNTFNDATGRDLNWFWNNWHFTNGYIDLALTSVKKSNAGYALTIENVGGLVAPVDVVVKYADGMSETVHQTPLIWQANQKRAVVTIATKKWCNRVELSGGIWMNADGTERLKWTA